MPDFPSPEDEATLYVLGELTAAERGEFEARMAQSTELRQAVRELEEGMVALSTGLPRRRPPSGIWSGIEKAVGRQRQPGVAGWWRRCWRNGWAVAALCGLGWSLHVFFLRSSNSLKTSASAPARETIAANVPAAPEHAAALPLPRTNLEHQLLQLRAEEISNLQFRIAAMVQETNDLSQLLAVERARLGETNRIKYYQFTAASVSAGDAAALSPAMQRAVLISIGRELGLLPMATQSRLKNGRVVNTVNGIDFVDLRTPGSAPENPPANQPITPPQTETQVADATLPSIPAFVSGDKLIVGVDSTMAPPNSSVTLTVTDAGSQASTVATFLMGENPTMITLPYHGSSTPDGDMAITVSAATAGGVSNSVQFLAPANP